MRYIAFLLAFVLASPAFAGKANVTFTPPSDTDLKSCRFFLRNAQAGVLAEKEVPADALSIGKVVLEADFNPVETMKGDVVARCEDLNGGISVDSTPFDVTFPVVPPRPATVTDVQLEP